MFDRWKDRVLAEVLVESQEIFERIVDHWPHRTIGIRGNLYEYEVGLDELTQELLSKNHPHWWDANFFNELLHGFQGHGINFICYIEDDSLEILF